MIFEESNKKDWEAMARYLANEMEGSEREEFIQRINHSEQNKKFVQQLKNHWNKMENYHKNHNFDTNKAWEKLYSKFEKDGLVDNNQVIGKQFHISRLLKIAAIFVLGILFTTIIYYLISGDEKRNWQMAETFQNMEIRKVILPDGSVVVLNAKSKLYYPEKFSGNERIVEFEGDAFFEITKNPDKPFIIKAKDAEIRVLGTSFNVNTNLADNDVEVLVETGKVKLSARNNNNVARNLEPGYIGRLHDKQVSKQPNTDINYLSWKTRYFNFNEGIKLSEAVKILNRAYHVNILISDAKINEKVVYTTHPDEPLDKVLNVICSSLYLKVKMENGEYIISY